MTKSNKFTVGKINQIIWKNILIIIVFTVLCGLIGGLYAKHKRNTSYLAKSSVIIEANLQNTDYKNSAIMAEKGMMKTYEEIVNNQETMKKAQKYLPKKIKKQYSADQLGAAVNVDSNPDSLILNINAKTSEAKNSVEITNAVAKASTKQLPQYSPNRIKVRVVNRANNDNIHSVTTPSIKKYAVLGAALGLLIGMIISFSVSTWKNI
ncbi:capsular biosynthesis protein [Limosilactobacillus sp. WF-MT5-A]|uniref:YveK family protein n=1 Tax=Limosilactobacillus agrestis TaxID=2759748 RepID=UPI0015F9C666|nr:Wzz/FepE/Etk N-terminal domain-containing protein [Limosilactobacillus agrestis]MBB1099662.1 capsular biosynthesis protein [Limosilactobacillus agrestis]MCD7126391.1 Wzz/FepE/Etk N-terminal domain-containing protein [Limosilactobacillus agrestis]